MNNSLKPGSATPDNSPIDVAQTAHLRRSYLKIAGILAFVAACTALIHFSPLKNYLTDIQTIKSALDRTGFWAPLIFFAAVGASIFIGAPRTPFCVVGGILFGFVEGLVLSQIATLVGAYGPFLFARYSAHAWVEKKLQKFDNIRVFLENPTIFDVFLFRQIPIWGLVLNLSLGSIRLSHPKFVVGSFLGFLPQAIVFTLIGSGLGEESFLLALSKLLTAIPVLAIGAYLTWRLIVRAKRTRDEQKKGTPR
jgi:uncharacterized membrane protein YdjX (TVP38/TMEM64 family)